MDILINTHVIVVKLNCTDNSINATVRVYLNARLLNRLRTISINVKRFQTEYKTRADVRFIIIIIIIIITSRI